MDAPPAQRLWLRFAAIVLLGGLAAGRSGPFWASGADREAQRDAALAALEAPNPEQRRLAQEWLGAQLLPTDFGALAQALEESGPETRARLVQAVGQEDRHLELAALALMDADLEVQGFGREALREALLRWDRAALDEPFARRLMPDTWGRELRSGLRLEQQPAGWFEALDRLDRLGRGPVPIVVDPGLVLDPPRRVSEAPGRIMTGSWAELLRGMTSGPLVTFVVHGWREDDLDAGLSAPGTQPWVRVCVKEHQRGASTAELVEAWVRGVQREFDPQGNVVAARALGQFGWPAGLQWLERRWLERRDTAALEGILDGAARSHAVPGLAGSVPLRELWRRVDRELDTALPQGRVLAGRVARALARCAPTGTEGRPLLEVHLEGITGLRPQRNAEAQEIAQWARLVVLEGQGLGSPAAWDIARGVFREARSPGLRLAALRALLACRDVSKAPESMLLERERELFLHAAQVGATFELAAALAGAGAVPAQPGVLGAEADLEPRSARHARLLWHLGSSATTAQQGAQLLKLEVERDGDLGELTTTLERALVQGTGSALVAVLAELRNSEPALALRLELRLGLASPESQRARLELVLAEGKPGSALWEDLGVLCAAEQVGQRAREALVAALEAGVEGQQLLPVIELALRSMKARRQDGAARALQVSLRRSAIKGGHPLAAQFLARDWPPALEQLPRDLERLDRRSPQAKN